MNATTDTWLNSILEMIDNPASFATKTITVTRHIAATCPRCGGNGKLVGYGHIAQGQCFKCGGSGKFGTVAKTFTETVLC